MLFSQRVFQNTSLPLKNARCTPAARAASTFVALRAGPVLVVADGEEDLVFEHSAAAPIGVDAGGVAHVVAVGFEPRTIGYSALKTQSSGASPRVVNGRL